LANNSHDDDALSRRIADAKAREAGARDGAKREESQGWTVATEFVGAVLGCAVLGWLIDRFAHTAPWGVIVMLLLGFAVGTRNVLRQQKKLDGE
jgi:ATP synthase protein I